MSCLWNNTDCKFEDTQKCETCFTPSQFYKQQQIRTKKGLKPRAQKADKRAGSSFEAANHKKNVSLIKETESNLTVNSGATRRQKGDENITGYIKISEELKTQMPNRVRGTKTFTVHREWLDKLNIESQQKGQEFWYLVFSFSENEGVNPAGDTFVITEKDMIFNMVRTMIEDRKRADLAAVKADTKIKETEYLKAEISALHSKIAFLEARIKELENT